jgi:hypothetical protein
MDRGYHWITSCDQWINGSIRNERVGTLLILLLLLLVLILAGAGFAVHLLWIAAVIFAVFWLVGVALGRGESAGSRRFYRW